MKHYNVKLYNLSEKLDLRKKKKDMEWVINNLVDRRKDIDSARITIVEKYYFEIEVEESSKNWHKLFGKILANNFGMREYCDSNDPSRLFYWRRKYEKNPRNY